ALKARILDAARREPSPTRRMVIRRAALLVALAMQAMVTVFLLAGGPRTWPQDITAPGGHSLPARVVLAMDVQRPTPLVVETAVGAAAIAALALWLALGRGGSTLGRKRKWLLILVVATPLALLAW